MDDKKIAAIIHVTDENVFVENVKYLQKLKVPQGFFFVIIPIKSYNKYHAYNFAMNYIDAKYKIYVDEKIIIQQENILSEIVKIFQSDKEIGIIGCSGAVELSTHGICLTSAKRCGKICVGSKNNLNDWGVINEDYREVEAIDGWFMATQYDISWREDIFSDNYFGDTAQCIEFKRRGYKTVVINQIEAWLIIQSGNFQLDNHSKDVFLNVYSADIFPLISVIIPTFNRPNFFQQALSSVLNQTYRHFEIVISDDSTNDETEKLIQPYLEKYSFIKYFRNKGFKADDNWNFLRAYNNPKAEYVNWLMDDDLFYPTKFEKMVEVYRNNPDVSLVTSVRDFIDVNGKIWGRGTQILNQSGKFYGNEAGKFLLIADNYIGEPTTVLIRKKFLRNNDLCWSEDHKYFYPIVDVSTWLQLLTKGNMYWFNEPLSAFRRHGGQSQHWDDLRPRMVIAWAQLLKMALDNKVFLKNEHDIRKAFLQWYRTFLYAVNLAEDSNYRDEPVLELETINIAMAKAFHTNYKIEFNDTKLNQQN